VLDILAENLYGIELDKLRENLNSKLGGCFDPTILKVDNFQEFLVNYLDDYLDIEVKKSLRTQN
jgi:hypothetical protein